MDFTRLCWAHSSHGNSDFRQDVSMVGPPQILNPIGASLWELISYATLLDLSRWRKYAEAFFCWEVDSFWNDGSVILRHIDVDEVILSLWAKNSIQGVWLTQLFTALKLFWVRFIKVSRPPIDFAQLRADKKSSTASNEGVLIVDPSNISSIILCRL